jgi:cell division protein ZapA
MEKRQLKIDLLGTSFVIQSDESTEHLNRLSAHVKSRIEEVRKRYPFAEPLTVAVLAALNIADEMIKVREGREPTEASELDSVAEKLISRIDDDLLDHTPLAMDGEDEPRAADGSRNDTAEARGQGGPKAGAPEPDEETPQS